MKPRIIAFYLPQFHPIPENDEWWGAGFTEWTNVAKAKPRFKGHVQPKIPADLGFYDLRLPETRKKQAELAKEAGIEGFCYYHYWFNGHQLLERPFCEVVESGEPNFPFCICWANHTWSNKTWERKSVIQKDSILIEQTYPGKEDHVKHFLSLLPAFKDERYIKVDGKLLFLIYDPYRFNNVSEFINLWNDLASKHDIPDFYFVGMTPSTLTFKIDKQGKSHKVLPNLESSADIYNYILSLGFDGVNSFGKRRGEMLYDGRIRNICKAAFSRLGVSIGCIKYDYERTTRNYFAPEDTWENVFPTILPQWDRTPRASFDGIYTNISPEKFKKHIRRSLQLLKNKKEEHQILFLKSWNEWGEGNYVEPDQIYGHGWLNAIREAINSVAE